MTTALNAHPDITEQDLARYVESRFADASVGPAPLDAHMMAYLDLRLLHLRARISILRRAFTVVTTALTILAAVVLVLLVTTVVHDADGTAVLAAANAALMGCLMLGFNYLPVIAVGLLMPAWTHDRLGVGLTSLLDAPSRRFLWENGFECAPLPPGVEETPRWPWLSVQ